MAHIGDAEQALVVASVVDAHVRLHVVVIDRAGNLQFVMINFRIMM